MKKRALNPQQMLFVNEYIVDRNGTAAAQRAGYAFPAVAASKLLKHVNVKAEIDRRLSRVIAKVEQKADLSAERVLTELAAMAFIDPLTFFDSDSGQLLPVDRMPASTRRALTDVVIEDGRLAGFKLGKGKRPGRTRENHGNDSDR